MIMNLAIQLELEVLEIYRTNSVPSAVGAKQQEQEITTQSLPAASKIPTCLNDFLAQLAKNCDLELKIAHCK